MRHASTVSDGFSDPGDTTSTRLGPIVASRPLEANEAPTPPATPLAKLWASVALADVWVGSRSCGGSDWTHSLMRGGGVRRAFAFVRFFIYGEPR